MTTFPLIDCSEMLAIDAKTLRHWLRQANIPLHSHSTDARVKCLTMEKCGFWQPCTVALSSHRRRPRRLCWGSLSCQRTPTWFWERPLPSNQKQICSKNFPSWKRR